MVIRRPGIIECGLAFCTLARWIKIGPPFYLVPDIIALGSIEEHARVNVFVVCRDIQTVCAVRMRIAKPCAVLCSDQTISVYLGIPDTSRGVCFVYYTLD